MKLSFSLGLVRDKTLTLNRFKSHHQNKKRVFGNDPYAMGGYQYQTKYQNGIYNSFEDEHKDQKEPDVYKLPPKWIDIYDETKDELGKIKEISFSILFYLIDFLPAAQIITQKSIARVKEMIDARATHLDLEIQKLLDEAMMKIRTCELNMDFIEKEQEETDEDYKIKMNMQKALALQIQEVTQELRLQQKSLLENLNRFQSSKKNPFDFSYEDNHVKQSDSKHLQQFETQMQVEIYEMEHIENIALDRNEKIERLVKSINQLNDLFKQMNRLVIEQGTILDRIDFNIENTFQKTMKGKEELIKGTRLINVNLNRRETHKKTTEPTTV